MFSSKDIKQALKKEVPSQVCSRGLIYFKNDRVRELSVEEYRAALLIFYELNSAMPMKKIFIDQYKFAAANYLVK